jgi:hypothetical protein
MLSANPHLGAAVKPHHLRAAFKFCRRDGMTHDTSICYVTIRRGFCHGTYPFKQILNARRPDAD